MTPREVVLNSIKELFPNSTDVIENNNLINPNLFSPFSIELPQELLTKVKTFAHEIYQLKETVEFQNQIPSQVDLNQFPRTPSLFTCLDFHYTEETGLKLIEINTNASLYLPFCLIKYGNQALVSEEMQTLLTSFKTTFLNSKEISILDLDPKKEGLYFEFLILRDWLIQNGYQSNIISLDEYPDKAYDCIYNRYTDFYFSNESSNKLLVDYLSGKRIFSPNPREYHLLANKKRLDLLRKSLMSLNPELAKLIPETLLFNEFQDKEDVWNHRKKYFFKPSQSFGSKGVFRGKSVSRKAFDNFFRPDFIAQEYCPPGKVTFQLNDDPITMKFDLRFYVFDGEVQNYGARLYQGQTTNMRTTHGGLAAINFQ